MRQNMPVPRFKRSSRSTDYEDISQISAPVRSTASFVPSSKVSVPPSEKITEHVHLSRSMGPMSKSSGIGSGNASAIYYNRPTQTTKNIQGHTNEEANRATHIEGPNIIIHVPPQYMTAWGDAIQYEGGPLNQRNYLRPRPNCGQGDFTAPKVNLPTFNGKTLRGILGTI